MNLSVELFLGHDRTLVTVRFFHVDNVLRVGNAHAQQVGRGHVWAALIVGLPQNEGHIPKTIVKSSRLRESGSGGRRASAADDVHPPRMKPAAAGVRD